VKLLEDMTKVDNKFAMRFENIPEVRHKEPHQNQVLVKSVYRLS